MGGLDIQNFEIDMNGYILGISAYYHDSAACLVKNGKVIAAAEQERFSGIKHDSSFPEDVIKWLFVHEKITGDDIKLVCFYEEPDNKASRVTSQLNRHFFKTLFRRSVIKSSYINRKEEIETKIKQLTNSGVKIAYTGHHNSHLAYSYYTSPFKHAAILSVDGVGGYATTMMAEGKDNYVDCIRNVSYPHSLGMMYSTFTAYLGFKPNNGEYKVMGLAPYGDPSKYRSKFADIIKWHLGEFKLNMKYFDYEWNDHRMFSKKLIKYLGILPRLPEEEITQDHKDLAAALQETYEQYLFKLLNKLYDEVSSDNLCLSGGCAYNGVANGKIVDNTMFNNVWIPPAPSDAGSCIGACLYWYYTLTPKAERVDNTSPYLGPEYSSQAYSAAVAMYDMDFKRCGMDVVILSDNRLVEAVSQELANGKVVGWFEGRMEFGARALGNRSILAVPTDPWMQAKINRVVKKRESFRPFAPMVIEEHQPTFFNNNSSVPYMNTVVGVRENVRGDLPAVTHVDGTARVQTVTSEQHLRIYKLLEKMKQKNGYPILLNTSFNMKGQTIVRDPMTAIDTFLGCEMDVLVLGNYLIRKKV